MQTKTAKRVIVSLLLVLVCAVIAYHHSYPIKQLHTVTLPQQIRDAYQNGHAAPAIQVYDRVELGDKVYFLISMGEELGSVTVEKGLTGRYRFTHLGYGDGAFRNGIVEHDGRKYLLYGGRDVTAQISKISVEIHGEVYQLELSKAADHFLLCTEVKSYTEDRHVLPDQVTLFNAQGEDITEQYDLSGGGIQ